MELSFPEVTKNVYKEAAEMMAAGAAKN